MFAEQKEKNLKKFLFRKDFTFLKMNDFENFEKPCTEEIGFSQYHRITDYDDRI